MPEKFVKKKIYDDLQWEGKWDGNLYRKRCTCYQNAALWSQFQLFFSNVRTVSKFPGKGLMVVPFNPADFCLQTQSTQKKYSLDPINRSREMCHSLVSRCIIFLRTNYKRCAIAITLTLKKKEVTEVEYSSRKMCKPENYHMPILPH